MRIALFHDLSSGGAKRTVHELATRLAARHEIDVYAPATAEERFGDLRPLARRYHRFDYAPSRLLPRPLGRLNALRRWRDLGRLTALSQQIAAVIDAGGYDVVLAEPSMWSQAPLILPFLATPVVYSLHEPPRALYEPRLNDRAVRGWRGVFDRIDPLPALYRARAARLDRAATRAAHLVLVNSRFTAEQVQRIYGLVPRVVYHGVDVGRFRPLDDAARRREVLSVGAVQPSKGFEFVVRALGEIPPPQRPPLRIVGNAEAPGERAHLVRLAGAHGVALAIEVGIDDATLVRRYAEASLLVYAPHREPFGLAALEAMACGTPVVAVAEGGIVESVQHDGTGVLVARDTGAFAAAVRALLDDCGRRRRMGERGRADMCARWTWELAAARIEAELLAAARGAEPTGAAA